MCAAAGQRMAPVIKSGPGFCAQVYKLISVTKVTDLTDVPFIARELMLIKVRTQPPPLPAL